MASRTLILFRHAKSDWSMGLPDHDRVLNVRGRRDAPVAGEWIDRNVGAVDLVVVSSAQRTQETWALASPNIEATAVETEPLVYEASVATLLNILQGFDDRGRGAVRVGMLVGHNPGMEFLAQTLAREGEGDALERIHYKFPTGAIAVLHFDGPWSKLAPSSAVLTEFVVPRG